MSPHFFRALGSAPYRHHRPDEPSGGHRQRVAIARARVAQPELRIADEPTANLDSQTTQNILDLMWSLNEERGVSFVFATHDPILDNYAKRKVAILDGKIAS